MAHTNDRDASDEEFEDAISNLEPPKINEESIAEIIKKQNDLKLPDDDEPAISDDKNNGQGGSGEEEDDEGAAAYEEALQNPDNDSDDEQGLIEMEKVLTEPELKLRKEHSHRLKQQANDLFKKGEADEAIELYSSALQICPTRERKDRAILFANRAAAKIKIDDKTSAIKDCNKAINLWPDYVRALLRRAKLYHDADKLDEALKDYELVYKLDPCNHEAREALVCLPPLINERNEKMKAEVMDKLKDLGNMILKPFGLSTANFEMQQDSPTGGYSINFKQNQS